MENQTTPPAPSNAGQTMGILALVFGIISLPLAFIPCVGEVFAWPPALLAIIFGAVGLSQAKKGGGKSGLPLAGLIIGAVSLVVVASMIFFFAKVAKEGADIMMQDSTFMQGLDSAFHDLDSVQQMTDSIK